MCDSRTVLEQPWIRFYIYFQPERQQLTISICESVNFPVLILMNYESKRHLSFWFHNPTAALKVLFHDCSLRGKPINNASLVYMVTYS